MPNNNDMPPFDVLDPDDDKRHEQEVEPLSDTEADRIKAWSNNPRGPLERTHTCTAYLNGLDYASIARKLVEIIDFMAKIGVYTTTFLYYLSWNLDIPGHMMHEQSVIR
jgi:hypothetical protein